MTRLKRPIAKTYYTLIGLAISTGGFQTSRLHEQTLEDPPASTDAHSRKSAILVMQALPYHFHWYSSRQWQA